MVKWTAKHNLPESEEATRNSSSKSVHKSVDDFEVIIVILLILLWLA